MSKLLRTTNRDEADKLEAAADVTIANDDAPAATSTDAVFILPKFTSARLHRIIRPDGTSWMPDVDGFYVPQNAVEFDMCRYYVEAGCMELFDPSAVVEDSDTTSAD